MKKFRKFIVCICTISLVMLISMFFGIKVNARYTVDSSDIHGSTSIVTDCEGKQNDLGNTCSSYTDNWSNVKNYLEKNNDRRSNSTCVEDYICDCGISEKRTTYTFTDSDCITSVIPLDLFKNRGIHIAIGTQYGFYVNTRSYSSDFYRSTVLIFKTQLGEVTCNSSEQSIVSSVQPVFCADYFYCRTSNDYHLETCKLPCFYYTYFKGLKTGYVVPCVVDFACGIHSIFYENLNNVSINMFGVNTKIKNIEPNVDKNGTYLYRGEILFDGQMYGEKGEYDWMSDLDTIICDVLGFVPVISDALGVITTAKDVIDIVYNATNYFLSCNPLEYVNNTQNRIVYEYVAEADKQVKNFGSVIRNINMVTSSEKPIIISATNNVGTSTQYIKSVINFADDLPNDIGTSKYVKMTLGFLDSNDNEERSSFGEITGKIYDVTYNNVLSNSVSVSVKHTKSYQINGQTEYFISYTPRKSGYYYLETVGKVDTYLCLYDKNFNKLSYNDDGGVGLNGKIGYYLTQGQKYYLSVRGYSTRTTGTATVILSRSHRAVCVGTKYSIAIQGENWNVFEYLPASNGTYSIETTGSIDTYMYLLDQNGNLITYNDDGGSGRNSKITYTLSSSNKYYICVRAYSTTVNGTSYLSITKK